MSEGYTRALLLMEQNRHKLAVKELEKYLATEPNDPYAHSLAGLCLAEVEDFKEASRHVEEAIRLAPDFAFAHYASAYVFAERNRLNEALAAINESIRLDPENESAFALLARIHLSESRHQPALAAAERGLQIDPQNIGCQNLRAMALKNLGRHDDAADALEGALARNPENAVTHANKGWALLEKNQPDAALRHFQEALRLDPELDWAREGIVVALKGRYRLYALMLKYFLWMSKLSSQRQWMVILGMLFASRGLRALGKSNPDLAPFTEVLRNILFGFVLMTWITDPLFNLALRLSPYGRLALKPDQVRQSTLVGILVALTLIAFLLAATVFRNDTGMYLIALGTLLMIIPASVIYKVNGWRRKLAGWYTIGLGALAVGAFAGMFVGDQGKAKDHPIAILLFVVCGGLFLAGILVASFGANFLLMGREKK